MKQIYLTKEAIALVDDEDYSELIKYKWSLHTTSNGGPYAYRTVELPKGEDGKRRKKTIFMHRQIMNCPDDMTIDHMDRNGLNNQKLNMQKLTRAENTRYMQIRKAKK